jgi:hypothetical protein
MKIIYQVVRDIEDLETSILVECTSIRVAQITHAVAVELFPSDSIDIVESDVAETDQEALDLLRLAYNKADLVEGVEEEEEEIVVFNPYSGEILKHEKNITPKTNEEFAGLFSGITNEGC